MQEDYFIGNSGLFTVLAGVVAVAVWIVLWGRGVAIPEIDACFAPNNRVVHRFRRQIVQARAPNIAVT